MPDRLTTRREFLQGIVPSWLTARTLKATTIIVAVFVAASWAIESARRNGLANNLKLLGLLCAVALLIGIIAFVRQKLVALSGRLPPAIIAFGATLGVLLHFGVTAATGAYLYHRWQSGDDLTAVAIALAMSAVITFRDELNRRNTCQKARDA